MAIIQMNAELYRKYVMEGQDLILVEFFAPWCGYCKRIAPVFSALAEEKAGEMLFAQVNIDDSPAIADREQIEAVPTMVLYRGGKAIGSTVAPETRDDIDSFLRRALQG